MIAALLLAVALQPAGYCVENDQVGFDTVDGCMTEAEYNTVFADPYAEFDALSYVFGLDVERKAPSPAPAAERSREFMGEELLSVAELIEQVEEAFDNPAFQ